MVFTAPPLPAARFVTYKKLYAHAIVAATGLTCGPGSGVACLGSDPYLHAILLSYEVSERYEALARHHAIEAGRDLSSMSGILADTAYRLLLA